MLKASKNLIKDLKKQRHNSCLLFLDNIKIIKDAVAQNIDEEEIEHQKELEELEKLEKLDEQLEGGE